MIITLGDALKELMQKLEKKRRIDAPTTPKQIGATNETITIF